MSYSLDIKLKNHHDKIHTRIDKIELWLKIATGIFIVLQILNLFK